MDGDEVVEPSPPRKVPRGLGTTARSSLASPRGASAAATHVATGADAQRWSALSAAASNALGGDVEPSQHVNADNGDSALRGELARDECDEEYQQHEQQHHKNQQEQQEGDWTFPPSEYATGQTDAIDQIEDMVQGLLTRLGEVTQEAHASIDEMKHAFDVCVARVEEAVKTWGENEREKMTAGLHETRALEQRLEKAGRVIEGIRAGPWMGGDVGSFGDDAKNPATGRGWE